MKKASFVCTLIIGICSLLFTSCNLRDGTEEKNTVYSSEIRSIFIYGEDVYAVGSIRETEWSLEDIPALWKNGKMEIIRDVGTYSRATSVFVSNESVYVTIYAAGENKALLWINGESQILGDGMANDVYVEGNDVYVAGQKDGVAVLWKNGVPQRLDNKYYGSAESVFVRGNDGCVVGYWGAPGPNSKAFCYTWKDDINTNKMEPLGNGSADAVFISDKGDKYIAGELNNVAVFWKNGKPHYLENKGKTSRANAITVNDVGNIIVAGWASDERINNLIWVDGKCYCPDSCDGIDVSRVKTVVSDGNNIYFGGCRYEDELWPVWKYDGMSNFCIDSIKRVLFIE